MLSTQPVGLRELATRWQQRGDGYSFRALARQSSGEGWVRQRREHWARARERADQKAVETAADVLVRVVTPDAISSVLEAALAVAKGEDHQGNKDRRLVLTLAGLYGERVSVEHSGPGGGAIPVELTTDPKALAQFLADAADAILAGRGEGET